MRTVTVLVAFTLALGAASASSGTARVGLPDFAYTAGVSASPYVGRDVACIARDGDTPMPWRLAGTGVLGGLDWAPDGGRFVIALAGSRTSRLRTAPADPSGGFRALTSPRPKTEWDTRPDWSPDGSEVAFVREVFFGPGVDYRRAGLWLIDAATHREWQVAREMPGHLDWSPSGDRLAVRTPGELTLYASNGTRIWTMSRNANGLDDVAWSPSGDLIAARFGQEILLTTPERTPVATIELRRSDLESLESGLSWSPDGQLLAVGGGEIYDRTGRLVGRYAPASVNAAVATDPRWTPDGTVLIFRRGPAKYVSSRYSSYLVLGAADLYLSDARGSDPLALTSTPALDEGPVVFRPGHAGGTAGTALPCFVAGSSRRDVIRGTSSNDLVFAGAGNDVVYGRGGDDVILAGEGADLVRPGKGHDVVLTGRGNDRVEARDRERDRINGGPGRDWARVDSKDSVSAVETLLRRG